MSQHSVQQRRRRVRLRDLETLMAVVQAGGMRKAAAGLHLSQPAVSRAMRELEDSLGVRLLQRGPAGAEATVHGQALIQRARAVLDELHNALQELDWLSDPEAGEVRLGGGDTQQAGVLALATQKLLARHGRMRLSFESAQAHQLVGLMLPQRMIDLAVIRPAVLPLPADIDGEALYHEQLHVVVGPAHPLARRRKVALADLAHEHWILSRNERMAGSPLVQAFADAGQAMPERVTESGTLQLRHRLLVSGRFVTCMPHTVVGFARRHFGLRVLPVALPRWPTPTMVLWLRGRVPAPATRACLEALREVAATLRLPG
jgi:DNA-binding transcriptional LysR family regulator